MHEGLRTHLFRFYDRVQAILAPGLQNAQFAYAQVLEDRLTGPVYWLDFGCGRRLFPPWMPNADLIQEKLASKVKCRFGIDMDLASLRDNRFMSNRVLGDITRLPFGDRTFDLISANMVVEHVSDPARLLAEAYRVLRPRGGFLFHTPNLLSYATLLACVVPNGMKGRLVRFFEDRKEEDVFLTFYRMNSPGKIRALAKQVGFEIIELRQIESSAQAVMLGPLVILELLWIRLLRLQLLRNLRSNLIVVLRRAA